MFRKYLCFCDDFLQFSCVRLEDTKRRSTTMTWVIVSFDYSLAWPFRKPSEKPLFLLSSQPGVIHRWWTIHGELVVWIHHNATVFFHFFHPFVPPDEDDFCYRLPICHVARNFIVVMSERILDTGKEVGRDIMIRVVFRSTSDTLILTMAPYGMLILVGVRVWALIGFPSVFVPTVLKFLCVAESDTTPMSILCLSSSLSTTNFIFDAADDFHYCLHHLVHSLLPPSSTSLVPIFGCFCDWGLLPSVNYLGGLRVRFGGGGFDWVCHTFAFSTTTPTIHFTKIPFY